MQSHGFGPRDRALATDDGPLLFPLSSVTSYIDSSRDSQVFHTIAGDQMRLHRPEPKTGKYSTIPFVVWATSLPLHRNTVLSFRSTLFVYSLRRPSVTFFKTVSSRIECKYMKAPRDVIQE
jgi:hypothetical protein